MCIRDSIYFVGLEQEFSYQGKDWNIYSEFVDTLIIDTIYVKRDSLLFAIKENRSEQEWNEGIYFGKNKCQIENIIRIDKPLLICDFKWVNPNDYLTFYLELENRGLKCHLDSLKSSGIIIDALDSLPIKLEYNETILLSEKKLQYIDVNHAKILAYYRDEQNKSYVSEISMSKDGYWFDSKILNSK